MKSHLIVTPTANMSKEDWLRHRINGLGASDIGTIFGFNQYKAPIELFYEKLDPTPVYNVETIHQFMGHYQEDPIADLWQYWDKTQEAMIVNYRSGKIMRRCRKINAYVSNPQYPWLFVSLDRIINKGERGEEGALEIKTIAGYEANKWDTGIPPSHLIQVITQMLVCEFSFGEIATLRDGRQFDVWPFEFNPNIAAQIVERTKAFWDNILHARRLMTEKFEAVMNHNMRKANELQAQIELLEPGPDGSEAYERFLKDKFKRSLAEVGLIRGTAEELNMALGHRKLKDQAKEVAEKIRLCENSLKRRIGDGTILDFGKDGRVSWKGDPRRFLNQVK